MLSPGETGRRHSARASLSCAVTPFRCAAVEAIQNDAKRDSFSHGFRDDAAVSRACGAGWSKQLYKIGKRVFIVKAL
jgi:hypothetical protein